VREFLLYSRTGWTSGNFKNMIEGGRLDIVYQCALMALFKAQSHRNDVIFHVVLNGPPRPPTHIEISGADLRDARVDERTWEGIFKKVLYGHEHPGIKVEKCSLQELVKRKSAEGHAIYILGKKGDELQTSHLTEKENMLFVIGDHIGIPKKDEGFVLRYGKLISLGKEKYLAASCIDILNYNIDKVPSVKVTEEVLYNEDTS